MPMKSRYMKSRYKRRRDQKSKLWRKRRRQEKARRKAQHVLSRNEPKGPKMPNVDTSLKKQLPLMDRILLGVREALFSRQKQEHQQHQSR